MNKLIKVLEQIGETQSVHQTNNILSSINNDELVQLESRSGELYCIPSPGDDDDD